MKVKVASCHKVTTKENLVLWLETLPNYISTKRTEQLIEEVRKSKYKYILWRQQKFFTVW